jgi:hypothetical protein
MKLMVGAVVLASALTAASPDAAVGQVRWHFAGLTFPATIDTFVSQAAYRWPDNASLGVSLTYVVPGDDQTELTVYVYPLRDEDTAAAHGDATAERDRALDEIRQYALQYRQLDEFRVDTTGVEPLTLADGDTLRGAHASFFFRAGQHRVRSLLRVFVSGGRYVKFRMTFDESATGALAPHLQRFLVGALTAIRPEGP